MAASSDHAHVNCPCDDFFAFQDALKKLRQKDDKIKYALNRIIPTRSFEKNVDTTNECKHLYEQMASFHGEREEDIKRCITVTAQQVDSLRKKKSSNPDDETAAKQLMKAQQRLRLMQNELHIEEVIKGDSLKVFYEKCRNAYTPPVRPGIV